MFMKYILIISLLIAAGTRVQTLNAQNLTDAKDLIDNERFSSAEELLEAQVSAEKDNREANYLLVKTYLEQDKTNEAKGFVETRLKTAFADPVAQIAYARYLLRTGNTNESDKIFALILNDKKNKRNADLLLKMAEVMIEEEAGNAKLGLEWLAMAAKRDK